MSNWIWLDPKKYSCYEHNTNGAPFCMAEFKNSCIAKGKSIIHISADSRYMLFVNDELIGRGPASAGSDFLYGVVENAYFDTYEINITGKLEIKIVASSVPMVLTENAFGYSGVYFELYEADTLILKGDETWDARYLCQREGILKTDYTKKPHKWHKAKITKSKLRLEKSPLEPLVSKKVYPVKKYEADGKLYFTFDKIYSSYPILKIKAESISKITIRSYEIEGAGEIYEEIITEGDVTHLTPRMRSVGEIEITVEGDAKVEECYLDFTSYPVKNEAGLNTSDLLINDIYKLCIHTCKICRQALHLDSPTHQEHLACTGDYFIQALIEYYNMYDPVLTRFDIYRTSKILKCQDGRLFHTTYSLIYPMWIYDYYMHTADKTILQDTKESLYLLLKRFDGYISKENGLIEYAPDYMFVDWVVANCTENAFVDGGKMMSHGKMEGYSLHHPPKSLGQSVMCMFYYKSHLTMASLFKLLGDEKTSEECLKKAENMKKSINTYLYDAEKDLYLGGLNTKNLGKKSEWLPENNGVKYYLKQANVLAVLYDIAPDEKKGDILKYVLKDLSKLEMQPYFYHFLLEALHKEKMFDSEGFSLIKSYSSLLEKCPKGLCEAWENMQCDYSHAWGGTPAYILKKALSGIEILEPGYKKIRLKPRLCGLEYANLDISTPYGNIRLCLKEGEKSKVVVPSEITVVE